MFDWIQHTNEYHNWGYNFATFAALGTFGITCWQLWALWRQFKNIKTGKSVSINWHTYFAAIMLAYTIYAMYQERISVAMLFNATLSVGHLRIVNRLRDVKGLTVIEGRLLWLLPLFPAGMLVIPWLFPDTHINLWKIEMESHQILFLLYSTGTVWAQLQQTLEMKRTQSRGDFSGQLLLSYIVSTAFWAGFVWFAIYDPTLRILTSLAGAILIWTAWLWIKYKEK